MWWKIYSWIVIIIAGLGMLGYLGTLANWTIFDWITVIDSGLIIFILYSFLYNRDVLAPSQWQIIFWYEIISTIIYTLIYFSPLKDTLMASSVESADIGVNVYIFLILVGLPFFYANYVLAYKPTKITKKH